MQGKGGLCQETGPKPQKRQGMLILIGGPSGAGKGALCQRLLKQDDQIVFSVSATTRKAREGEREGIDYTFISEQAFDALEKSGQLLEHATVHNHRYGTPRAAVEAALNKGQDVLLDVDSQGALNVIRLMPGCVSVFILPPSFATLKARLRTRNTDDEAEIKKRLFNARAEIKRYHHYDYALINDELDTAFERLWAIITAERMRTKRFHPDIPEE